MSQGAQGNAGLFSFEKARVLFQRGRDKKVPPPLKKASNAAKRKKPGVSLTPAFLKNYCLFPMDECRVINETAGAYVIYTMLALRVDPAGVSLTVPEGLVQENQARSFL